MSRRRNLALKIALPILVVSLGIGGAVLSIVLRPRAETSKPEVRPPLVRVETIARKPWQFIVRAHGTVVPRSESNLISQVSGEVDWMSPSLVSGGDFEEGEVLLRIDRADYEVALESARATVARGESEHERAKKELARQKRLSDRSVASETRYDDAVNAELVTNAKLREARARLDQAIRDLARTEIHAPYAGRVRGKSVDIGEFVIRGNVLATLYAVDFAEVRLPIPDYDLRYLDLPLLSRLTSAPAEEATTVRLRARFAGEEHEWPGRIVRTEGEIDPQSRMVHVVARVEDPYGRLASGQGDGRPSVPLAVGLFVGAEILGRRLPSAAILPRSALRQDDRVLVVDPDGRMRYRAVEVLRRNHDEVIVGEGLSDGERICISPIRAVVDGMLVRVAEPEEQAAAARAGVPNRSRAEEDPS